MDSYTNKISPRVLMFTQKVDEKDPVLGFVCDWIDRLALNCDPLTVVCLEKGSYKKSKAVVHSLGKESGKKRMAYIFRFFSLSWRLRNSYDTVFIHMNEEYALLGGFFWRIMGKRIVLWRNHAKGSWRTRLAVFLSHVVLCTSKESFTAKFKKSILMPVGVDERKFSPIDVKRLENTLLYIGRVSPVKNIECLIQAVGILKNKGINAVLDIYGPVQDEKYKASLVLQAKKNGVEEKVNFRGAVNPSELPRIYSSYTICVNTTGSGSFDKTIVEALFCKTMPIASNPSLVELCNLDTASYVTFEENNPESLALVIEKSLSLSVTESSGIVDSIYQKALPVHSLTALMGKLVKLLN